MSPSVREPVDSEPSETSGSMRAHVDPGEVPPRQPRSAEEVSLQDVVAPLIRRWKLLLGLPLALAIFSGLLSLLLPSVYTAQTTLTPATSTTGGGLSGSALASLAGLAGQLGMASGAGGSLSPDFIADILKSREVLTATLKSEFPEPPSSKARPLLEIMRIEGKSEPARLSEGVRRLERLVKTSVDHSTGIVTLTVKARNPDLAAAIANRMRDVLNTFNLERRQSQSHEQARFTRERLAQAESELHQAEAAQLRFLQANRNYSGSPILEFEQSRLRRAVDLKQEVYISLAKSYEEARIAEVRDTPVITTIDSAVSPDRRSSPRPLLTGALGLLLGGILAFLLIFLMEQRGRSMTPSEAGRQNLREVWQSTRGTRATPAERGPAASGV
jgi:uncharacterized protein involved in exopolysaccharide biosynthesis